MSTPGPTLDVLEAQRSLQVVSGKLSRTTDRDERIRLEHELASAKVVYALLKSAAGLPPDLDPGVRERLSDSIAGYLLRVAGEDAGGALRRARREATRVAA